MNPIKLVDWLKLGAKQLAALAIMTSAILFVPEDFARTVGFDSFRRDYLLWIGFAWLCSLSLLITHAAAALWPWLKRRYVWWVNSKDRVKRLHQLTSEEQEFLGHYIWQRTRTQYADMNNGVVCELEALAVVRRATNISSRYTTFAYNIQPWAWDYLHAHPELLGVHPEQE